ncbi:MAG: RNHCP domain-containing protein [bacterium]
MKKFIKNKEDFECEKCHTKVIGTGYTNHCPNCLYSKHVDVSPGDRANPCGGLMKPVRVEGTGIDKMQIVHRCVKCGVEKNNKIQSSDNIEMVANVAKEFAKEKVEGWKLKRD